MDYKHISLSQFPNKISFTIEWPLKMHDSTKNS